MSGLSHQGRQFRRRGSRGRSAASSGRRAVAVIGRLVVARDQPHIFTVLERQGPIAIVLDFVQPIAIREFFDRQCLHWFDERRCILGIGLHEYFKQCHSLARLRWQRKGEQLRDRQLANLPSALYLQGSLTIRLALEQR